MKKIVKATKAVRMCSRSSGGLSGKSPPNVATLPESIPSENSAAQAEPTTKV